MSKISTDKLDQQILVVRTQDVFANGYFSGFLGNPLAGGLLQKVKAGFGLRRNMEVDAYFKQLIPYVVLMDKASRDVFTYVRSKHGTEGRLHDLLSIGVGGHVEQYMLSNPTSSVLQMPVQENPLNMVFEGAVAELKEEVGISATDRELMNAGLINEDATDVGHVHLAVLYLLPIDRSRIALETCETDLQEPHWCNLDALELGRYELWSQIALSFLRSMPKARYNEILAAA